MSLRGELSSLKMNTNENVIEYFIRTETSASKSKNVIETVSEFLIIHLGFQMHLNIFL